MRNRILLGMALSYGSGLVVMWWILERLTQAQFDGAGPAWAVLAGAGVAGLVAFLLTFIP